MDQTTRRRLVKSVARDGRARGAQRLRAGEKRLQSHVLRHMTNRLSRGARDLDCARVKGREKWVTSMKRD